MNHFSLTGIKNYIIRNFIKILNYIICLIKFLENPFRWKSYTLRERSTRFSRKKYEFWYTFENEAYKKITDSLDYNIKEFKESLNSIKGLHIFPFIYIKNSPCTGETSEIGEKDYTELIKQYSGPEYNFYKEKVFWCDFIEDDIKYLEIMTIDGDILEKVSIYDKIIIN